MEKAFPLRTGLHIQGFSLSLRDNPEVRGNDMLECLLGPGPLRVWHGGVFFVSPTPSSLPWLPEAPPSLCAEEPSVG